MFWMLLYSYCTECHLAEGCYVERRYAECCFAECRGALITVIL